MNKIRVGIAGAAGYTGGELLRILLGHPLVEITYAHSRSQSGKKLFSLHHDLLGRTDQTFSAEFHWDIDVLFLCMGHGESVKFLKEHQVPTQLRIIDLSTDFRHSDQARSGDFNFVYGLPEFQREKIREAKHIANPGCFATAIQLALLPLAQSGLLPDEIQINATTGSTGAGQSLSETSHFTWRANNLSVYKAFDHQHLREIGETLSSLGAGSALNFIPQRGAFTRGILAAVWMKTSLTQAELDRLFTEYYAAHPFTFAAPFDVDLKQVVNTNFCYLQVVRKEGQALVISAIDNLLKGASGQAVQNMNLLFGLEETTGLQLKSTAF